MGRKSLKEQRVNEILNAFELCLVNKGLKSSSLDDIAIQAGMARKMLRHYVGNRNELIALGVSRIIERFNSAILEILDSKDTQNRFHNGIDFIFSEAFNDLPETKLVAALLPESLYDDNVKTAVQSIYISFKSGLEQELERFIPYSKMVERERTAYSIMCLAFGGGWMRNIGFDHKLNEQNKRIAISLITQLQDN